MYWVEDSRALLRMRDKMFYFGDYVQNQKTGNVGKVIGYGRKNLNNSHTSTVKVLVIGAADSDKRGFVEEDSHSAWTQWPSVSNFN